MHSRPWLSGTLLSGNISDTKQNETLYLADKCHKSEIFFYQWIANGVVVQKNWSNYQGSTVFKAMDDGRGFLGGGRMMTKMATSRN